ncbi:MAG TPA: ThuA domain-containing protein [Luteolibacter sp.]|nr:ThuA domain-containing protein [Luteolibacter sp.]
MKSIRLALLSLCVLSLPIAASAQEKAAAAPLKALLVVGGCCHDYAVQKDLIKAGLEARLNLKVDVCYSDAKNTKPEFDCYKQDNWADGYDVIIHDECAADVKDPALAKRILAPHIKGVPGVNLHCAMHSFRVAANFKTPQEPGSEGGMWFEYIGVQSTGHGPKKPIDITYVEGSSPVVIGLANWRTGDEELYNNIHVYPTTTVLAKGKQETKPGSVEENVVVWSHLYGPNKTKVFSTSLGHFNEIIADDRYMDLVARGLLWSVGKLDDKGVPVPGYWIEK